MVRKLHYKLMLNFHEDLLPFEYFHAWQQFYYFKCKNSLSLINFSVSGCRDFELHVRFN